MGFFDNVLTGLQNGTTQAAAAGVQGLMNNLLYRWNNASLTGKEREQNAFNAEQAELAYNRSLEADSTKYQRAVADMQAAGINPMLAASGVSGSVQSSPASGSSTPNSSSVNLGDLVNVSTAIPRAKAEIASMKSQTAVNEANVASIKSQTAVNEANAEKIKEETRETKLGNDFFVQMRDVRAESERISVELTKAQRKSIYKQMDLAESQITHNIEQARSEQERQRLYVAQSVLANAEASNIVSMQPYIKASYSAKTDADRKLANVYIADAAYRNGLIDAKVIQKSIEATDAKISVDKALSELNRVRTLIEKGDKHALSSELGLLDSIDFWSHSAISEIKDIVDALPIMFVK